MTDKITKIMNLLQFARKAGKIVHGNDACLRSMSRNHLSLIVLATDLAPRSATRINRSIEEMNSKIPLLVMATQVEISQALGLPITGIIGLTDKQFASRIMEYWTAE